MHESAGHAIGRQAGKPAPRRDAAPQAGRLWEKLGDSIRSCAQTTQEMQHFMPGCSVFPNFGAQRRPDSTEDYKYEHSCWAGCCARQGISIRR